MKYCIKKGTYICWSDATQTAVTFREPSFILCRITAEGLVAVSSWANYKEARSELKQTLHYTGRNAPYDHYQGWLIKDKKANRNSITGWILD
jgi:hypothetical protein